MSTSKVKPGPSYVPLPSSKDVSQPQVTFVQATTAPTQPMMVMYTAGLPLGPSPPPAPAIQLW